MLVCGMLGETTRKKVSAKSCISNFDYERDYGRNIRWRTSCLQEGGLADNTLDIHSLLVNLKLRLCDLGLVVLAIALRGCLCSLKVC